MRPQISKEGLGQCPICDIALERRQATANEYNSGPTNMTRRFWVGLVLTVPVLALMLSGDGRGADEPKLDIFDRKSFAVAET
jgi:Cu+-exporting ATPase